MNNLGPMERPLPEEQAEEVFAEKRGKKNGKGRKRPSS